MSSFGTVDGMGDNKGAKIEIEKLKFTPARRHRPTNIISESDRVHSMRLILR